MLTRNTIIVLLFAVTLSIEAIQDYPTQLVNDLFKDYINDVLPSCKNASKPIAYVDMSIRSILDVDEPRQIMTANVYNRWRWTDCRLTWNKSDYGGLESIVLAAQRVWIPDITLYDSAGEGFEKMTSDERRVVLSSDGTVLLLSPTIIRFTCKMDVTYFPYDMQICRLKWASWSYTGTQLDVQNTTTHGDLSQHVANGEWKILEIPVRHAVNTYMCCPDPFPEVTFYFIMERQCLYYMFNLVMPCLLITGIGLMVFLMPPETGEKMSLGITVMLSLCVFLLMVADRMPATSETIPLIAKYFASTIVMISVSCGLTVIVLNTHHQGANGQPVPKWLKRLLKIIKPLLLIQNETKTPSDNKSTFQKETGGNTSNDIQPDMSKMQMLQDNKLANKKSQEFKKDMAQIATMCTDNNEMLKILHEFRTYLKGKEYEEYIVHEWRAVAVVLDRLFFVIVTVFTLLVTMVILLKQADHINHSDIEALADSDWL